MTGRVTIGPAMVVIVAYVMAHPQCTKVDAARAEGISSQRFGYATIDRCIRAGLVRANRSLADSGRYELTVTDTGRRALRLAAEIGADND